MRPGRLSAADVIQRTADDRHWFDALALGRYRRVRLIRVAIVALLLLGAWGVWVSAEPSAQSLPSNGVEHPPEV